MKYCTLNHRTMPFYYQAINNPTVCKLITGLTLNQFNTLLTVFSNNTVDKKTGRTHTLNTPASRLVFILFYYRYYFPQQLLAFLFGVNQSQISRWISELTPVLDASITTFLSRAQMKAYYKSRHAYVVDATERIVNRPKNNQQRLYSGKKKQHTIKNQIVIDLFNKLIVHVSPTVVGKVHDFKLFKSTVDNLYNICKPGSRLLGDTGYQGAENLLDGKYKVSLPNKASKNFPLTDAQKDQNRLLSSKRVRVEHVIGNLKKYQILYQKFRGSSELASCAFRSICGLHNLRVMIK